MTGTIVSWLVSVLALVCYSNALSTLAPPSANKIGSSATNLFAPWQRADLKKKLIRAAQQKDEALVLELVEELTEFNPTDCPTRGLMGYNGATTGPLDGAWKLLYTNAKDAEAPARTEKQAGEPFGDTVATGVQVTTGQRIDAQLGECVNFIRLEGDAQQRPFDQLEITIKMTPLSDTRVRLDFLRGRALNEKAPLPFLKDFEFSFPPAFVGDFLSRLRGKDPNIEPPAYFDVLYIDNELRAHRTGEGKIFVQQRS